jgi:hypothetical protein
VTTRARITLAIGVVMIVLGSYIALRPLWAGPRPLSASRWLDMAFAAFFLFRGWANVRLARRAPRPPAVGSNRQ